MGRHVFVSKVIFMFLSEILGKKEINFFVVNFPEI